MYSQRKEYKLKNIDCTLIYVVWPEFKDDEEYGNKGNLCCEIISKDAALFNEKEYKLSVAYKDDGTKKWCWNKPLKKYKSAGESLFSGILCSLDTLTPNHTPATRLESGHLDLFTISIICDIESVLKSDKLAKGQLALDFGELFKSEKYTDFTIHADNQKFRCHKLVLTTRSSVFDHMLSSGMLESQNSEVYLTDISPNTVSGLLSYLYTDNVDNLPTKARGLIPVAEKYDLDRLKDLCGEALTQQIDLQTVVDLALLSDMYNVQNLRTSTVRYVVENKDQLDLNNPTWRESFKDSPSILLDIDQVFV